MVSSWSFDLDTASWKLDFYGLNLYFIWIYPETLDLREIFLWDCAVLFLEQDHLSAAVNTELCHLDCVGDDQGIYQHLMGKYIATCVMIL